MNGIINLYKEPGMTSHDCVFKLRKILGTKKIGHGGTLDPDVAGVLPIAVGKSTKVLEFMTEAGKVYEGEVVLGYSTETEDASGATVDQKEVQVQSLNEDHVDEVMSSFLGVITQVPPMYSAVKVNGRKLYEYARNNEEVERPQRQVTIKEFTRTSPITYENGCAKFTFEVACSKGTYVRTLAVDLAAQLGYPGHMSKLKRSASAGLKVEESYKLDQVHEFMEQGRIEEILLPMEYGVGDLVRLDLDSDQLERVRVGKFLDKSELTEEQKNTEILAVFFEDKLVAIYMPHPHKKDSFKPKKVLLEN